MTKPTSHQRPVTLAQDGVSTANLRETLNKGLTSANLAAGLGGPARVPTAAQPAPAAAQSNSADKK